jgi:hypothetical protein
MSVYLDSLFDLLTHIPGFAAAIPRLAFVHEMAASRYGTVRSHYWADCCRFSHNSTFNSFFSVGRVASSQGTLTMVIRCKAR